MASHQTPSTQTFTCPECEKTFSRKDNLTRHVRSAHRGQRFVCDKCAKSFSRNGDLKKHRCAMPQQQLSEYRCGKCPEVLRSPRELSVHFRRIHSSGSQSLVRISFQTEVTSSMADGKQCEICKEQFSRMSELIEHILTIHTRKREACDICHKSFSTVKNLWTHKRTKHEVKQVDVNTVKTSVQAKVTSSVPDSLQCEICNKQYSKKTKLKRHILSVHIGKRETCDICYKKFTTMRTLQQHDLKVHEGKLVTERALRKALKNSIREYKCKYCPKSLKTSCGLRRHVSSLHQEQCAPLEHRCRLCKTYYTGSFERHADKHHGNLHKCMVCDKVYGKEYMLRDHMTVHIGKRPYLCEKCGKSFALSASLVQHQRTHEEKIPCKQCGKLFLPCTMHIHLNTHSDKRPYQCEICGKGFKNYANLETHKWSHSSVRPHSCDVCGDSFKLPHQLRAHKKRH